MGKLLSRGNLINYFTFNRSGHHKTLLCAMMRKLSTGGGGDQRDLLAGGSHLKADDHSAIS